LQEREDRGGKEERGGGEGKGREGKGREGKGRREEGVALLEKVVTVRVGNKTFLLTM
jgi:hypothetical protein